jgi:hypothetical protein
MIRKTYGRMESLNNGILLDLTLAFGIGHTSKKIG